MSIDGMFYCQLLDISFCCLFSCYMYWLFLIENDDGGDDDCVA